MRKRLYIKNQHHALSAMIDFGMQFEAVDQEPLVYDKEFNCLYAPEESGTYDGLFWIREESEELLMPQVRDLVRIQWLDGSISYRLWDEVDEMPESALDRDIRVQPIIIQRNNLPFPPIETKATER